MSIISYRGQLKDEQQRTIRLGTNDGLTGYKIKKFQIMGPDFSETVEAVVKIWKVEQDPTSITGDINFDSPLLLAAALYQQNATGQNYPLDTVVIFDSEVFNQDIYISQRGDAASAVINYYLELEKVKLDLNEATVATLKDMRGRE